MSDGTTKREKLQHTKRNGASAEVKERGNSKPTGDVQELTVSFEDKSRGRVEIEADLCKGCLLCIEACPPGVLVVSKGLNKMGYHPAEYVGERCTACGICFYICPEPGTIRVYKRVKHN